MCNRLPKRQRKVVEKTVFILEREGKFAILKRPETGLLAGLWQLPDIDEKLTEKQAIAYVRSLGFSVTNISRQVERQHIFTHISWQMTGVYLQVTNDLMGYRWLTLEEIATQAALPTAYRQFLLENE